MKILSVWSLILFFPFLIGGTVAHGSDFPERPGTRVYSLNDLLRQLMPLSPSRERELRRLSSFQEQLYLYEQRMRGEGLPEGLARAFAGNYNAILSSLVEERIASEDGRELLSIHRQLLAHTHEWMEKKVRDPSFPLELLQNIRYFREELDAAALARGVVPDSVKTPLVTGYQVWLGELLAWGCESGSISPGARGRIEVAAQTLERFEESYKADGHLTDRERELLHQRLINLSRDTIRLLSR